MIITLIFFLIGGFSGCLDWIWDIIDCVNKEMDFVEQLIEKIKQVSFICNERHVVLFEKLKEIDAIKEALVRQLQIIKDQSMIEMQLEQKLNRAHKLLEKFSYLKNDSSSE